MKISQREAHALKRRVRELEEREKQRRVRWASEWPGGVHLHTFTVSDAVTEAVRIARALEHACVVVRQDDGKLRLHALPLAEQTP